MSGLKWEEPAPKPGRSVYPWDEIAAELKTKPGEWACLGRHSTNNGVRVRKAFIPAFAPAGSFEATMRNTAKNQGDLYVGEVTA